jgi:hypothetical protein
MDHDRAAIAVTLALAVAGSVGFLCLAAVRIAETWRCG